MLFLNVTKLFHPYVLAIKGIQSTALCLHLLNSGMFPTNCPYFYKYIFVEIEEVSYLKYFFFYSGKQIFLSFFPFCFLEHTYPYLFF